MASTVEGQPADTAFHEDFEAFYQRELKPVTGLAFVLSGSHSGAEDLAQEAFMKAYRQWDAVSSMQNPQAWIRRVVANASVSGFRRRAAETRALIRIGKPDYTVPQMSDEAIAAWDAVRRLPARQAQAVVLKYFDRSSVAEIAEILECSENTVKTHLKRARATLASILDEGDPT